MVYPALQAALQALMSVDKFQRQGGSCSASVAQCYCHDIKDQLLAKIQSM